MKAMDGWCTRAGAIRRADISKSAKALLRWMIRRGQEELWYGVETMAKALKVCGRTVQRALRELQGLGVLALVKEADRLRNTPRVYSLAATDELCAALGDSRRLGDIVTTPCHPILTPSLASSSCELPQAQEDEPDCDMPAYEEAAQERMAAVMAEAAETAPDQAGIPLSEPAADTTGVLAEALKAAEAKIAAMTARVSALMRSVGLREKAAHRAESALRKQRQRQRQEPARLGRDVFCDVNAMLQEAAYDIAGGV